MDTAAWAPLDTGMAHERSTGQKWIYRTRALTPALPGPHPVHVWPASGGEAQVLSMEGFNARFVVDYRFDLQRYNRARTESG